MHLGAQNSPVFYGAARLSDQLRDITLFYEVMNKKGAAYRMTLAPPLAPEPWLAESADLGAATEALAAYVGSAFERRARAYSRARSTISPAAMMSPAPAIMGPLGTSPKNSAPKRLAQSTAAYSMGATVAAWARR